MKQLGPLSLHHKPWSRKHFVMKVMTSCPIGSQREWWLSAVLLGSLPDNDNIEAFHSVLK